MDTVDNRFLRRSEPVFCPPRLWATGVDNQGPLWTAGSCAHPMHRDPPLLPSSVPRNTQVLPRPTHHVGVTAFTLLGDGSCFVAEQWTGMWRSGPSLCTTHGILWASGGQPRSGPAGRSFCPQSVDSGCPHIPMRLSWADHPWGAWPVETIRDNSGVPRLWTVLTPRFCGETDHLRSRIEQRCTGVGRTAALGRRSVDREGVGAQREVPRERRLQGHSGTAYGRFGGAPWTGSAAGSAGGVRAALRPALSS